MVLHALPKIRNDNRVFLILQRRVDMYVYRHYIDERGRLVFRIMQIYYKSTFKF